MIIKGQQPGFVVTISPIDQENEKLAKYYFKKGEAVYIKAEVKNLTNETVYIPIGIGFSRPILYLNGQLVPYREVIKWEFSRGPGGSVTGLLSPKPNESQSEILDLTDFYAPLKPGEYQLTLDRRFFKIGGIESNAATFSVLDANSKLKIPTTPKNAKHQINRKQKTGNFNRTPPLACN